MVESKSNKDEIWHFSQLRLKKYEQNDSTHIWIGASLFQYFCFDQFKWHLHGKQYQMGIQ